MSQLCLLVILFSFSLFADTIAIIDLSGKSQIFNGYFDETKAISIYNKVKNREISGFQTHAYMNGQDIKNTVSISEYKKVADLLKTWDGAEKFKPLKVTEKILKEKSLHVHPIDDVNQFYFSYVYPSKPIFFTTSVCDCVVVMVYNYETSKGFMVHLSYEAFFGEEEHFKKLLKDAISIISFNDASKCAHNDASKCARNDITKRAHKKEVSVYLVTRQASNFSQKLFEVFLDLDITPKVSSVPGILNILTSSPAGGLGYSHQFSDPSMFDFDEYMSKFVLDKGLSVYIDMRNGKIYQN